jgi:hypothetical protein
MDHPDHPRQVAMKISKESWHLCTDCLEPMATAIYEAAGGHLRPGLIKLGEILRDYKFFERAIPTLQVVVSVECAKDVEQRIASVRDYLDFVNDRAWTYQVMTYGPPPDDYPEEQAQEEIAWTFSERYWKWFWEESDAELPDHPEYGRNFVDRNSGEEVVSRLPEAVHVFASAYHRCCIKSRHLAIFLWQLSAAIKLKIDALPYSGSTVPIANSAAPALRQEMEPEQAAMENMIEGLQSLKPCLRKAFVVGWFAERMLPQDATYSDIWEYLRDNGTADIPGQPWVAIYQLPDKKTFEDYYSKASSHMGMRRKGRRQGTTSRSIVKRAELP